METTFSDVRGEIILQLPRGRQHCRSRRDAGEAANYRRMAERYRSAPGEFFIQEMGGRPYHKVLEARASRLADPLRRFIPIVTRGVCPCCKSKGSGKYRLTDRGRELLARKRKYRGY